MKILIIDDHILFAEGMKYLLKSCKKTINSFYAEDFDSAIDIISTKGVPDLIMLDINLSDSNGLSLIKKFHNLNIWTPILVVSATDSPSTSLIAMEKGASGFISKASDSATLLNAIKTVLKGDNYPPANESKMKKTSDTEAEGVATITTRQYEILCLLSQGMLNKQIAYELSISANTVKAHLHHIFRELNANNRTAAVQNAQKHGLI